MMDTAKQTAAQLANQLSQQGFMNCYLRETGKGNVVTFDGLDHDAKALLKCDSETFIAFSLEPFNVQILIPVRYYSLAGHHQFNFPIISKSKDFNWHELDLMTLASLCLKDIEASQNTTSDSETNNLEILSRLINSYKNMAESLNDREQGFSDLLKHKMKYLVSEQSLLIGHQMHPLPKSREGFNEQEALAYSPEGNKGFKLHYLSLHPSIVLSDSALELSAKDIIVKELKNSKGVPYSVIDEMETNPDAVLMPMHPWQLSYIKTLPKLKKAFNKGLIKDLGPAGPDYFATSSVRTVASIESQYQYKFSMNITITNSKRLNLFKELQRGVEFTKVWAQHECDIKDKFPSIETLNDPAYITLQIDGEPVDEVSVILRQNPFNRARLNEWRNNDFDADITALAALCQDDPFTTDNRLTHILNQHAKSAGISTEQAAKNWFEQFLAVAVSPMLFLYKNYGLAFEAHQQNTLIKLEKGFPKTFYYRDNQGTGYIEEWCNTVRSTHPDIGVKSECLVPLEFADHHFTYYFFVNNVLGVINALGCTKLIDEPVLLAQLKSFLTQQKSIYGDDFSLLDIWLNDTHLACKGNLLTRVAGLDELLAPLDSQSIYFQLPNPLVSI